MTWNASVIGIAIGVFVTEKLAILSSVNSVHYLSNYLFAIARYVFHGAIELAAYFIGALAGAIISIALSRNSLGVKKMDNVLRDSTDLILISIFLLVIGAIIESAIIPIFF